jgi:hypothetical protein
MAGKILNTEKTGPFQQVEDDAGGKRAQRADCRPIDEPAKKPVFAQRSGTAWTRFPGAATPLVFVSPAASFPMFTFTRLPNNITGAYNTFMPNIPFFDKL